MALKPPSRPPTAAASWASEPEAPATPPARRRPRRQDEEASGDILPPGRRSAADPPPSAQSAPPTPTAAPPPLEALRKQKPTSQADIARLGALMAREGLLPAGKFAPSTIHLADGRKLFVSNTLARGGFGKYRLGVMDGREWGVKELHTPLHAQKKRRPHGRRAINITPAADARAEIELLQASFVDLKVDSVIAYRGRLFLLMEPMRADMQEVTVAMYDHRLAARQRLDIGTLALADGANSLARVHAASWLHRDIKPPNMLVSAAGEVLLGDWGLATELACGRPLSAPVGTPAFAAPELWQAGAAASRGVGVGVGGASPSASDIWSLGVTFAAIITGRPLLSSPELRHLPHPQRLTAYVKWHARLPRLPGTQPDGPSGAPIDVARLTLGRRSGFGGRILDLLAVPRAHSPFAAYFELISTHFGDGTTSFLLDRMLNPDPAQRIAADGARAWAASRLGSVADVSAARALLAQIAAADPQRDLQRRALAHYSALDLHGEPAPAA